MPRDFSLVEEPVGPDVILSGEPMLEPMVNHVKDVCSNWWHIYHDELAALFLLMGLLCFIVICVRVRKRRLQEEKRK